MINIRKMKFIYLFINLYIKPQLLHNLPDESYKYGGATTVLQQINRQTRQTKQIHRRKAKEKYNITNNTTNKTNNKNSNNKYNNNK